MTIPTGTLDRAILLPTTAPTVSPWGPLDRHVCGICGRRADDHIPASSTAVPACCAGCPCGTGDTPVCERCGAPTGDDTSGPCATCLDEGVEWLRVIEVGGHLAGERVRHG